MQVYELGMNKKSFSLFYNNGEIWCEHLDSLYDKRELVIDKFNQDIKTISKPSTSSFIALNLDETDVDKELLEYIICSLNSIDKPLKKLAIVGLSFKMKKHLKGISSKCEIRCIDDFEKAKQWLI